MKIREQSLINTPDTHLSTEHEPRKPARRRESRGRRPTPKGQLQGETSTEETGREWPQDGGSRGCGVRDAMLRQECWSAALHAHQGSGLQQ